MENERKNNEFIRQYIKSSIKLRTKNCVEINDDTRVMYNKNSQIKFKTSMTQSNLYGYSNAYVPVSGSRRIQDQEQMQIVMKNDQTKEIKELYLKIVHHALTA